MPTPKQIRQNEAKRRLRKELETFKEVRGCHDCVTPYPHYVLEFDHVPERGVKFQGISTLVNSGTINGARLQTEMAKCDVVCANCHKVRTWKRKQVCESVPESRLSTQES